MKCVSRHSRPGGDVEEDDEHLQDITAYEEQRNLRRKALHDEVERALVDSGFGEAAQLRPLFPGELAKKERIGGTKRKVNLVHRSSVSRQREVQLRRSVRNVQKEDANKETSPISRPHKKRVHDTMKLAFLWFCMHGGWFFQSCIRKLYCFK